MTVTNRCEMKSHNMNLENDMYSSKAPCKRAQRYWPKTPKFFGCYMLRPFAHPVAYCCMLLRVVMNSCIRLHATAHTDGTTPNIVGPTMSGVVASVCT